MKKSLLLLVMLVFGLSIFAERFYAPEGERTVSSVTVYTTYDHHLHSYVATQKCIYYAFIDSGETQFSPYVKVTCIEGDRYIVEMKLKKQQGEYYRILVLLNDGSVLISDVFNNMVPFDTLAVGAIDQFRKIAGDDIYVLTNNLCTVTRDSGQSYQIDTAGLGNAFLNDLDLDSNQRVYLTTNHGLYTQELVSNQWIQLPAYPANSCKAIHVDAKQNIWVSTNSGIRVSSNFGVSFQNGPAGITTQCKAICTDAFGNLYVISNQDSVYFSSNCTAPFVPIDAGIRARVSEPVTITCISADTVLQVGTPWGMFTSVDQGSNWVSDNEGIQAEQNFGLVKTSSGRLVVSNSVGIFTQEAGDTVWQKRWPVGELSKGSKIFKDGSGKLYTTSQNNKLIWISSDNGDTWSLDTTGFTGINAYSFFVDQLGNMHASVNGTNQLLYVRNSGGSWALDTVGFNAPGFCTVTAWGVDSSANLYVATTSTYLQKRPLAGGNWVLDTAGLLNQAVIYDLAVETNGTMWAGTYVGAFKKVGGTWQQLANPPGTGTSFTNSCFVLSVDGANAVWTQWTIFNVYGHAIGTGVYYTLDGGSNWTSMNVDTITFRQLVSVGDTTYAVSYVDGLWRFTRNGGVVNIQEEQKENATLLLYPNPATSELTIFSQEKINSATISIIDVTGRKVLENKLSNTKQKTFDISKLPRGLYVVDITGEGIHAVKKFVKE